MCYMQRRINTKSSDGVGIYPKRGVGRNRNKTEKRNQSSRSSSSSSSKSIIESDNNCGERESTQILNTNISSRQLKATQQILDTLGNQFNSLNALKQSKSNSVVSSECNNNNNYYNNNINSIEQLLSVTTNRSVNPQRPSRQVLDSYVKYNIENSDKCGCHFEHNNGEKEDSDYLLNESEKSYRKQYLSENNCTDLESSHRSETSIEDDSVLLFGSDRIRHACLIEARLNHGLFIDKKGKQCHTSVNTANSKKDKTTEQRQGLCFNHKTELEQRQQQCLRNDYRTSSIENGILHQIPSSKDEEYLFITKTKQQENNETSYSAGGSSNNRGRSIELNKFKLYYDNQTGSEQVEDEGENDDEENYELICETGNALESLTDSVEEACGGVLSFQSPQTNLFKVVQQSYNSTSDAGKPLSTSNLDYYATTCPRLLENPLEHPTNSRKTRVNNNSSSNSIPSLLCSQEFQFSNGIEREHFQELQNVLNLGQSSCADHRQIEQTDLLKINHLCSKTKVEDSSSKQNQTYCYFNELELGSNVTSRNIWKIENKIKRRPLGECCFSCEDLLAYKMGLDCNKSINQKCNTSKSESDIINSSEEESKNRDKSTIGAHHIASLVHANKQHTPIVDKKEYNFDNINCSAKQQKQPSQLRISLNSNLSSNKEEVRQEEEENEKVEQEKLSKKKRSLRGLSSLENVKSMRAVKDIMKISVPSLSSLQYLPSQVDSSRAKVNSKKQQKERNKTTNSKVVKDGPIKLSGNNMNSTQTKVITIVTESDENLKHDESCLFHRLCLCTCIARGNHYMEEGAGTSASNATNDKENQSRENINDSDDNLKNLKTVKRSKSCLSDGSSSIKKASSLMEYEEKQSPSFLSLLKSSPTRTSPKSSNNYTSSPLSNSSAHQRVKLSRNDISPSRRLVVRDGESVGELMATRSISRNSATTDSDSGGSSSLMRARSTSFNSSQNQRETPLSSLCEDEVSNEDCGIRPQSACSIQENIKSSTKKGTNYRKLLSPSKLFSTNSSSNNKIDGSDKRQQVSALRNKNNDQNQHQKSFFSRSLNRLSNRSKRNKKYWLAGENNQVTDLNQLSRVCVSPTISISTASNIDASLEDSVTSLDEVSSPLKVNANNKLGSLSTVDIDNRSNLSATSYDMTRAKSYKYDHIKQNHQNNIYLNLNSPNIHRPARYGSEISGFTSENSDITSNDRAFSLPPSPRSGTRRRNVPVSSSRSPRLTHSPVPFHSPATQSTKIEDGLKVCSMEHFEKHIDNIKEIQLEAQKRLFKAWINHFCPNLIRDDLITELQDGIKLIGMLAYLTRDKKLFSHYDKLISDKQSYINRIIITHSARLRNLSNVSIAIDYLRRERKMKLINLNPMDIVCGKANVVLGLCWNIILNFQLEQNFLKYLESCDEASSQPNDYLTSIEATNDICTSRLSNTINEDCARYVKQSVREIGQLEEYTPNELIKARKKLLDHINRRFNLKLTNLTSNLLDGEVLFVIIKNLISECGDESQLMQNNDGKSWKSMNNDEKLDHCFDLALAHLNVPRLFSSVDLRQQTISDNNSKPLLVYLTMLLGTDTESKHQSEDELELLRMHSEASDNLRNIEKESSNLELTNKIEAYLEDLERDDRYEVDKLQLTLRRINKLEELINCDNLVKNDNLNSRYLKLRDEAEKVESLISWINQADALFETPQKSAQDLTNSIEKYKVFFSPENVPHIRASLCPTLERQYRECISTAQQRVHIMEQTLKNWVSYEKARKLLRDWLVTAEVKLTNALLPVQDSFDEKDDDEKRLKPSEQHKDRLEDLIAYFELEPIDTILHEASQDFGHESITSPSFERPNVARVLDTDGLPLSLSFNGDKSKSSSLLSMCSTASRMSTLQNCKKASYYKLFDDFELKCRLLAAMLDADQREALLLGVKELRSRLKYITEQRVPQVVSELKWNINCCEMTIEEQDEDSDTASIDDGSTHEDDLEEALSVETNLHTPCIETSKEFSMDENEDLRDDSGCPLKYQGVSKVPNSDIGSLDSNTTSTQVQMDKSGKQNKREKTSQPLSKPLSSNKIEPKVKSKKNQGNAQNNNKNVKQNAQNQNKSREVKSEESESPWSFFSWLSSREPKSKVETKQPKSKRSFNTSKRNKKSRNVKTRSKNVIEPEDKDESSYSSMIWHKVVRAYRASFSLNIILLICLAGICVVPLIHKDACCELTAGNIPPSDFSMGEKPT